MAALKEIHEAGNTIVMVTHNPDLAAYGDRVIKMLDGKIEEEYTGASLRKELTAQKKEAEEIAETATNNTIEPQKKSARKSSPAKKKVVKTVVKKKSPQKKAKKRTTTAQKGEKKW